MDFQFPEREFVYSGAQTANRALAIFSAWDLHHPDITRVGNYLINSKTKVAMLLKSARYPTAAHTLAYRVGHEHTQNEALYYRTYSAIIKMVSAFFSAYPTYHLMIDVRNSVHQCMLYVVRNGDRASGLYTFYGFDPNQESMASCLFNLCRGISKRAKFMYAWTSCSYNDIGLCYSMTWRFLHLVMFEGYDPILFERIGLKYYFVSKKKQLLNDTRRSSIGFVRTHHNYFRLIVNYPP